MQEQFVALNPYRTNQYFIILDNSEVHRRIPSASYNIVENITRANHCCYIAGYPRSNNQYTLGDVKTSLSIEASALSVKHIVAGIITKATGAALCNVM